MTLRVRRNFDMYRFRDWEVRMMDRIEDYIDAHQGCSPKQIQEGLGTKVTLVIYLGYMEHVGRARHEGEGKSMKWYTAPADKQLTIDPSRWEERK